ncbi:hypothetical protein C2L65_42465 [Paraburkholderia terrae]|uniref:Uncharacterized protein n=1 Tax=Paraburkholderia terrae TaxID=311230 RepID=A0A2I8F3B8_9BURK|nr:hypothetical protein C2L65_42465 [Paraburkholderia terrae]
MHNSSFPAQKSRKMGLRNIFQSPGVNENGKPILTMQLKRHQMAPFFANRPARLVAMEACASALYTLFSRHGFFHKMSLMSLNVCLKCLCQHLAE